jgi:hypothetical protein
MMTVSRSFAPSDAGEDAGAAPVFPILPFAYMAYAEHCTRDYADYVDRLTHTKAPWPAEETLGLHMLSDMNQAFFSLVWAPLGAMMTQAGERR